MSLASEQAAIELRVDWDQHTLRHRNRHYFAKFNFWRDILPGALSLSLPDSDGDWVSEPFDAGELVPPWSERNIHRVKRSTLRLQRRHGPPVRLVRGRHFPRYIAAGTADIFAGNVQPLRATEMDADTVTLDLNHALARFPLTLSARIDQRLGATSEHGGLCNDALADLLADGVGLETLYEPGSTDWFSGDALAYGPA